MPGFAGADLAEEGATPPGRPTTTSGWSCGCRRDPIRVLLADDQRVVREGLGTLLGLLEGIELVGTGADGEEALALAAEYVDAWNTWFAEPTTRPRASPLNARIGEAAERAGRDPTTLRRSVCVYVQLGGAGERKAGVTPVRADELPARLREYQQAGADEVILVASPITEASVRALAPSQCGVAFATAVAGRNRPCPGRRSRCGVVERAFEAPPA